MGECRRRPGIGLGDPKSGRLASSPGFAADRLDGSSMFPSSQSLFPPLRDLSNVVPPVRGHSEGEAEGDV